MVIGIDIKAKDKTSSGTGSAKRGLEALGKVVDKTREKVDKMNRTKVRLIMDAYDRVSPVLSKVKNSAISLTRRAWRVTVRVADKATTPIRGILRLLKNPLLATGVMIGIGFSVADSVNVFAGFEASMSKVKALSGANEIQMQKLTDKAKEMGAKTKFSGTESAEAFIYMSQAGWGVKDMMDGISGVMSLAASDGLDLATTTDIVSNALTAFGLKAKDTQMFADVLAVAASATNTDVRNLGESFKYVAPVAGALKYNIKDVSLALGIMSNNAIKGSMAGTSLKTSLANMSSPTKRMREVMKKYDISLTTSQGKMKSLKAVLDNLRKSLGGLAKDKQVSAATKLFGKEAMAGMLSIINTSKDKYNELTKAIRNSKGAADEMAATMQDNLAGAFEQLGGAYENVQLTFGDRLKPHLISMAGWIEEQMPAIENAINNIMDYFDKKVYKAKATLRELMNTNEWKNADLFGKVSLAWDKIIAEPFSEWWDSTGRKFIAGKFESIGKGLGNFLKTGLLALFGADLTTDAVSVGGSFAKGFMEGFDAGRVAGAIKNSLIEAVRGIWNDAWSSSDTSGISKALVAVGGYKAVKGISSMVGTAGSLFGGKGGESGGIGNIGGTAFTETMYVNASTVILSGNMMGSRMNSTGGSSPLGLPGAGLSRLPGSTGTQPRLPGPVAGTGFMGGLAKIGTMLGSGATTTGGLAAVGAGSIAGGLVGGVTLISGAKDIYDGATTGNSTRALKGGIKVAGVGAGALLGAKLGATTGAAFGGIGAVPGALIGAGIGGIASWFVTDQIKETNEKAEKAQKSTRELEQELQRASSGILQQRFGNLALSMTEVADVAERMVTSKNLMKLNESMKQSSELETVYQNIANHISEVNKLNWKLSMGFKLSKTEIESYKEYVKTILTDTKDAIEKDQYKTSLNLDIFISKNKNGKRFRKDIKDYYKDLRKELRSAKKAFNAEWNKAWKDGEITDEEWEVIEKKANRVIKIQNKLKNSKTDSTMEALNFKYGSKVKNGSKLDYDSFSMLQKEQQAKLEQIESAAFKKFKETLGTIEAQKKREERKLKKKGKKLSPKQIKYYEDLKTDNMTNYLNEVGKPHQEAAMFQLDTATSVLGDKAKKAIPILGDNLGKVYKSALEQAKNGDMSALDGENLMKRLKMGKISKADKAAALGLYNAMLPTTQQVEALARQYANMGQKIPDWISEYLKKTDALGIIGGSQDAMWKALSRDTANNEEYQATLKALGEMGMKIPEALASSMGSDLSSFSSTAQKMYNELLTQLQAKFKPGFKLKTAITEGGSAITVDVIGGSEETKIGPANNALGGFPVGRQLSWICEEGPEAIIPLTSQRRQRALELYERTGRILGVHQDVKKNARGGILGIQSIPVKENDYKENIAPVQKGYAGGNNQKRSNPNIEIVVNLGNNEFKISGSDNSEDVMSYIKENIAEIANEASSEIATGLKEIFSNTPITEGA